MSTLSLQDLIDGADKLYLKDQAPRLNPEAMQKAAMDAVRRFSRRLPLRVSRDLAGNGLTIYDLPPEYLQGFSSLSGVQWPYLETDQVPKLVDQNLLSVESIGNPATSSLLRTITGALTSLNGAEGIAIDQVGSRVFIANTFNNAILAFALADVGNVAPDQTISGALTELFVPGGIAVDTLRSRIVVANTGGATILSFPLAGTGNVAPSAKIFSGDMNSPLDISYAATTDEYVVVDSMNNSILIFKGADSGSVAATRKITGASTELARPDSVHVQGSEIFVSSNSNSKILVFNLSDNGNVAPKRSISGTRSEVVLPEGIFVSTSEIFVATPFKVLVFDINANGEALPLRKIEGTQIGMLGPTDLESFDGELFTVFAENSIKVLDEDVPASPVKARLRFLSGTPATGDVIRVFFTTLHVIPLNEGGSIEDHYEDILTKLTAINGLRSLASIYAQFRDNTYQADTIDYSARASTLSDLADRLEAEYDEEMDAISPESSGGETEWDSLNLEGGELMTHPSDVN